MLVELLVLGCVSWSSSRIFHRRPGDTFALELQLASERPHAMDALVTALFKVHVVQGNPMLEYCKS